MIKKISCIALFFVPLLTALSQEKAESTRKDTAVVDTLRPDALRVSGKPVTGNASIYDLDLDGSKTASGEVFFNIRLTAACNDFPLNSWVKVSNPKNKKYVILRINDRIPPKLKRKEVVVRVSQEGAKNLGISKEAIFKIKLESIIVNDSLINHNQSAVKDSLPVTDSSSPNSFEVIGKAVTGIASFYSFNLDGTKTATGERYRNNKLTAASNNFKLNTWVLVTNLKNNKSVIVRINDRMHPRMKRKGRVVDMSRDAAKQLDYIDDGLTHVKVEPIRFVFSQEVKKELDSLHEQGDTVKADPSIVAVAPQPVQENFITGIAGVYGSDLDGTKTAMGEIYRNNRLSAASNDFNLDTWVRVTNLDNDKSVILRINDNLHIWKQQKGHVLDVSKLAAKKLNFTKKGLAKVKVEEVEKGTLN